MICWERIRKYGRSKHKKFETLPKSKLRSIESITLKVIRNPKINETYYLSINDELNRYCIVKKRIRKNDKISLNYAERKRFIEYCCNKILNEFAKFGKHIISYF